MVSNSYNKLNLISRSGGIRSAKKLSEGRFKNEFQYEIQPERSRQSFGGHHSCHVCLLWNTRHESSNYFSRFLLSLVSMSVLSLVCLTWLVSRFSVTSLRLFPQLTTDRWIDVSSLLTYWLIYIKKFVLRCRFHFSNSFFLISTGSI